MTSVSSLAPSIQLPNVTRTAQAPATAVPEQQPGTTSAVSAIGNTKAVDRNSSTVTGSAEQSNGGTSSTVEQLQRQIAELRKQLAKEQQALQKAISADGSPEEKTAAISAAQAQVMTTAGALQTATAALLEALTKEGGGSSGTSVSTTA